MEMLKEGIPEKGKTIMIVHNRYMISGGEDSAVRNERDLLEKKGNKVILYTRDNNEIAGMSKIRKAGMVCSFLFSFKTYHDICLLIKKEKIDVVHVHNTLSLISPSVYYAAVFRKVPVIQIIHNFRLICPNALLYRENEVCEKCLEKGLRCAVKNMCYHNSFFQTVLCVLGIIFHRWTGIYKKIYYICLTEFNREKLLAGMGKNVRVERVYIKPNFVEDEYSGLSKKGREILDKYCIYVGRLEKSKGIVELAKAWRKMEGIPLLVICGGGPEENNIKEIIKGRGGVVWLGEISHERVLSLMFYAEALIFSSRLYEGLPMTIVESMMCGTPVICKNIGNGADVVKRVREDMLYDTEEELYGILKKRDFESSGADFRKEYLKLYSPEANYRRYLEILDSVNLENS